MNGAIVKPLQIRRVQVILGPEWCLFSMSADDRRLGRFGWDVFWYGSIGDRY